MGKSSNQKQAEQGNLQLQQQQIALQRQQAALAQQAASIQQQSYRSIQPFAQGALGIGNQAMAGQASSALTAQPLTQLAQSTQQNRQNLIDFFGQSGQGAGGLNSGILAGPLANTYSDQAAQAASINQNAILQGMGIGFQGANALQGQQAIFNPAGFAGAASGAAGAGTQNPQQYQNPWMGVLGSAIGGLGSAFAGAGTQALKQP